MTETDNKTRYGRIASILIALAIVIAAFALFTTMNNRAHLRAEHQVPSGLHRAIGAAHQRVDGRLADRDQAFVLDVREHAFGR